MCSDIKITDFILWLFKVVLSLEDIECTHILTFNFIETKNI